MKPFKKVAIIGVGLIGGSLALALKKKALAERIVGVSKHQASLRQALRRRIIDQGSLDLDIARGADLVILATPVEVILGLSKRLSTVINRDCIVIDVGSTKAQIVRKLEKLFPNFVGTHPLAGSEKRGSLHAEPDKFIGCLCILTPTRRTPVSAAKRIKLLWKNLGARTVSLSPDEHDKIIAFISHLPHLIAFSLIGSVPKKFLNFAASGLRDTTRIAASDSRLWAEIFLSNRSFLGSIREFERSLGRFKKAIREHDKKALSQAIEAARRKKEILG